MAQIEISAAQTRIKNPQFFDILGVFRQFFVIMSDQTVNIFGKFSKLRPRDQFGLATPVLIHSIH
jgi:hypothetical protein